jgi:hypothetical protein
MQKLTHTRSFEFAHALGWLLRVGWEDSLFFFGLRVALSRHAILHVEEFRGNLLLVKFFVVMVQLGCLGGAGCDLTFKDFLGQCSVLRGFGCVGLVLGLGDVCDRRREWLRLFGCGWEEGGRCRGWSCVCLLADSRFGDF